MGGVPAFFLEPLGLAVVISARGVDEDPVATADGEFARDAVVHGERAHGDVQLSPEQRQDADAVFAGALRKVGAQNVRAGGQQVAQAGELGAFGAGRGDGGPAGDEGDSVAALPGVPLQAAQVGHAVVAVLLDAAVREIFGAVVAGEDEQGVFRDSPAFQGFHDLADAPVYLAHVVAVFSGVAHPLEFLGGHDGGMRRGQGEVQEEGFVAGFFDVAHRTAGDFGHDRFEFPSRGHGTGVAEQLFGLFRGRLGEEPILFEPGVRREIRHVLAIVVVEAAVDGAAANRLCIVDVFAQFVAEVCVVYAVLDPFVRGFTVQGFPVPAQVPLADAGGAIAVLAEKTGDGQPVGFDQGRVPRPQDSSFETGAPAVAAGEDGVAARGADAGRSVGIGEAHALTGQAVEVGGGDLGVGVVAAHVSVPHVVGQDVDDVGSIFHDVFLTSCNIWSYSALKVGRKTSI